MPLCPGLEKEVSTTSLEVAWQQVDRFTVEYSEGEAGDVHLQDNVDIILVMY